ncbi:SSD domain-containing protein [Caenorhabditis elegans]|uniref:SSD domain-containing protein n=1 Tax=Caenorhabditis elegans TaxID=6239 RepID=P91184_CAEEL|nr:SSD domain-containing protein [Caenorhabditis elegans]CCD67927.1 SSD domain-containing protein [Caenorhabditis elegans]|eukprot:NP_510810.3 PaTched Related family [Caenorhabditis elegans]
MSEDRVEQHDKQPMSDSDPLNTEKEHVLETEEPERAVSAMDNRQEKLNCLHGFLSLRRMFYLVGYSVGRYPHAYLIVAFLISINSLGMYRMVLKDRIRDGYTPTNAPSRYETDVLREFYNISGDPAMTIMILMPKNGTSMHAKANLDEAEKLSKFFFNEFNASRDGRTLRFSQLCEPYCQINKVFDLYKSAYDEQYKLFTTERRISKSSNLSYPLATMSGFDIHLERSLFGVELNPKTEENTTKLTTSDMPPHRIITNMKHVEVIVFIFRGDRDSADKEKDLSRWELDAYEWSLNEHKSDIVEVQIVGTDVLDNEMMKDGRRLTPFFAAGFGFEITFVSLCVILTAVYHNCLDQGKLLISLGAVLCPILAITSTYGIVSILGMRTNSFMLVMPFLVMGIGVDSCFLMIHSWQKERRAQASGTGNRLGMVYESVGPSITITSLTDFLSFAIGALAPTPETRLFCIASSIALALTYILQLVLFGPILAVATRYEHKTTTTSNCNWRKWLKACWKKCINVYCKILSNKFFAVVVMLGTAIYWYFAIYGLMTMKTRLDAVKILPKDSPLQRPNLVLTNLVWANYHPVTILINAPLDLENRHQMDRYWNMVDEFEKMHNCKGKASTLSWLRDYIKFSYHGEPFNLFAFFGLMTPEVYEEVDPYQANITTAKLPEFLKSPFFKHWDSFIHYHYEEGVIKLDRFMMNVAYDNTSSWDTRIQLMTDWRKVANNYSDLNVTVWEPNGMFVDQMLSLGRTATQTGIWTLVCMAVVCAIFIPNPCSIITATVSIASITTGVMGFLSLWSFDLDPVVMAAVLMSIGLSVDFIAHVAYHFQLAHRKEIRNGKIKKIPLKGSTERLEHTLGAVAWPMIQAGVSTICCILPLLFRASYSPSVFVAAIFLVVTFGMLHGLLILPTFLAALPESVTTANCYRVFLSSSSERSCRYVPRRDSTNSIELQKMERKDSLLN